MTNKELAVQIARGLSSPTHMLPLETTIERYLNKHRWDISGCDPSTSLNREKPLDVYLIKLHNSEVFTEDAVFTRHVVAESFEVAIKLMEESIKKEGQSLKIESIEVVARKILS